MSFVTKKYTEAIKMYPDLNGKKSLIVYDRMEQKGYKWNSLENCWENESEKEEIPVVDINIKCRNALVDDTIETLTSMFTEYGIEILNTPKAYPAKEKNAKGVYDKSKTHSTVYIQYRFPEVFDDESTQEFEHTEES